MGQNSIRIASDFFLQRIICIWNILIIRNNKRPATSFQARSFAKLFDQFFLQQYYINWPNFISACVYCQSYSVKCISCFVLRHLMTIMKIKILKFCYLNITIRALKKKYFFPSFKTPLF